MKNLVHTTLFVLFAAGPVQTQEPTVLTVVLEGGDVYDGLGGPPSRRDVGILGDRIVAIGDLSGRRAGYRLDVSGLAVVPGFIDIHSHAVRGVFRHPLAENYTRQGVTTVLGGPDGGSPYPIGEFLAKLDTAPPAINFALTVGHGTIRRAVIGNEDRAPSPEELEKMKAMAAQPFHRGRRYESQLHRPAGRREQKEITLAQYTDLVTQYREGKHFSSAQQLRRFDRKKLATRNDELPAVLDLKRPDEKRQLLSAILIHAEAAVQEARPEIADFYLDEAISLSVSLGEEEGEELQRKVHLAIAYELFYQRRIVDALRVVRPAATRFATDPTLQFAHASLAEIVGWLHGSDELLAEARSRYELVLFLRPQDARAKLRLGRVLMLVGEHDAAIEYLETALSFSLNGAYRGVGLLSLGNAVRKKGDLEGSIDFYRRALRVTPNSPRATVALSYTLRELGRHDESQEVIERSFARKASNDITWNEYLIADSPRHHELWQELRARLR